MRAFEQRHAGPLANVNGPVHFRGDVNRQLYDGQFAAVKSRLGVAVYALGDGYALVPPAHFHRRVAGRRLARQRRLHPSFQVHRFVLDVQMVGQDCVHTEKIYRFRTTSFDYPVVVVAVKRTIELLGRVNFYEIFGKVLFLDFKFIIFANVIYVKLQAVWTTSSTNILIRVV